MESTAFKPEDITERDQMKLEERQDTTLGILYRDAYNGGGGGFRGKENMKKDYNGPGLDNNTVSLAGMLSSETLLKFGIIVNEEQPLHNGTESHQRKEPQSLRSRTESLQRKESQSLRSRTESPQRKEPQSFHKGTESPQHKEPQSLHNGTKDFYNQDVNKEREIAVNKTNNEQFDTRSEEMPISEVDESLDTGEPVDVDMSLVMPSQYNFENPLMAINYVGEFKTPDDNFTKGCKWSPDGSCLLVTANDSKIRLFNLPAPIQYGKFTCESWFAEEAEKYSFPAVSVREKETVYDYCWYPLMRSDVPSSCCFASTCRDQPVHLWDAWTGDLICSYHAYNHLDEMVAAYSLGFSTDGSRLVAGFSKCLRAFYTQRPGRFCEQIDSKNQPGIISCMSFNPQLPSVFAAGSYLGSVGLYNLERNTLFCRMEGDIGGVTHLKFSSCGTKLFSGSRKNNEILCWDLRNPGTLLCGYKREVSTSQRIYFDLEPQYDRFLVSGDTRGHVLKWDLKEWETTSDDMSKEPSSVFVAHKDCTNGVSLHPFCPLLATSSGQRHFPDPVSTSDLDSSSEDEPQDLFTRSRTSKENTVKLWWLAAS